MVRRRASAVSNHGVRGPSFETPAKQAPQDDVRTSGCKDEGRRYMTVANIAVSETPLVLYTLRRADDALILGHRLSEWCGYAPMLEEDMALANMGLDLLGQARELYSYAARVE